MSARKDNCVATPTGRTSGVTLPLYIYTQVKFGVTPEVNAVATLLLGGTLIAFVAGSLLLSGGRRFRRP